RRAPRCRCRESRRAGPSCRAHCLTAWYAGGATIAAMSSSEPPIHDIGLVLAGAVSAGAYSAGVVDFFIEAMDALAQAQARGDPLAPAHRVRLGAVTGASAGAMTAGILAGILAGRPHRPVRGADPGPQVRDNALFESWVNRSDAD